MPAARGLQRLLVVLVLLGLWNPAIAGDADGLDEFGQAGTWEPLVLPPSVQIADHDPLASPPSFEPADGDAPPPSDVPAAPALTTCTLEPDEEFIGLDWARRRTFEGVCLSARWLDRLFGDETLDLNRYPIEGYVGFDFEKTHGTSPTLAPKLRLRLRLPNLSNRFDVFFERDDENKTIVGESDSAATRQLGSGEQNTAQVGLGYEILRGIDSLLSFRAGIRLTNQKPDPFVRSRYSLSFAKSERAEWRVGQSLFWRQVEGFGETTTLDYENRIGGPFIFQWNNSATVSQITEAFRWGSTVAILHPLDERRTMLYSYAAAGQTGQPDRVSSFGPRISYRQQMNRRWLFGEVYIGSNRTKDSGIGERSERPYIGAKIEAHFRDK